MDVLRSICRDKFLPNTTLVTTKWEELPEIPITIGRYPEEEENTGKIRYWREFTDGRSVRKAYYRHSKDSKKSAMGLLERFKPSRAVLVPDPLHLQEKLIRNNHLLRETLAGAELDGYFKNSLSHLESGNITDSLMVDGLFFRPRRQESPPVPEPLDTAKLAAAGTLAN